MTSSSFEITKLVESSSHIAAICVAHPVTSESGNLSSSKERSIGSSADRQGTFVYVGTSEGQLYRYIVDDKAKKDRLGGSKPTVSRAVARTLTGGRRISSITADEQKLIIGSSDGTFSLLNMMTLEISVRNMPELRGCSLVATRSLRGGGSKRIAGGLPTLCAIHKHKFLLLRKETDENKYIPDLEIDLRDTPASVAWMGDWICLGMRSRYKIISTETKKVKNLVVLDKPIKTPHVSAIHEMNMFIIFTEAKGLFYKFMEGIDDDDLVFDEVNSFKFPLEKSNTRTPSSVAYQFPYLFVLYPGTGDKSKDISIDVYLKDMFEAPLDTLSPSFGADSFFQPSSMNVVTDCGGNVVLFTGTNGIILSMVSIDKQLKGLLTEGYVDEAIKLFELLKMREVSKSSNVGVVKQKEIDAKWTQKKEKLFTTAAIVTFSNLKWKKAFDVFSQTEMDPREIISFFPDSVLKGSKYKSTNPLAGADVEKIISSHLTRRKGFESLTLREKKDKIAKAVREAKECAVPYLRMKRGDKDPEVRRAVDTALSLFLVEGEAGDMLRDLFSSENDADFAVLDAQLDQRKLFDARAYLYYSNGKLAESLKIRRQLAQGDIVDCCTNRKKEEYMEETVECLKKMTDFTLVRRFSTWVLLTDPKIGLRVFTERDEEHGLDPESVIFFLEALGEDGEYITMYLEHLTSQETTDLKYTTQLVNIQVEKVKRRLKEGSLEDLDRERKKLMDYLLETPYDKETLLRKLESVHPDLIEERCTVLSLLKRHTEAITILFKSGKLDEATGYCMEQWDGNPRKNELLLEFFRLYVLSISVIVGEKEGTLREEIGPILGLLEKYSLHLDPLCLIDMLPSSLPLSEVHLILVQALRSHADTRYSTLINSNLRKSDLFLRTSELQDLTQKNFSMNDTNSACSVCGRQIDVSKIFSRFPDGGTCHYACTKAYEEKFNRILKYRAVI